MDLASTRFRLVVLLGSMAVSFAYALQDSQPFQSLSTPDPKVALHPARLEDLDGYSCAQCHTEVAEEWASTTHALSWKDEVYQQAMSAKRRPRVCHSCHIPRPLLIGELPERPKARDDAHDLGVSCESCHEGPDGVMLGPRDVEVEAHATARSDLLAGEAGIALCSTCHDTNIGPVIGLAKDFEAARLQERGLSCVGCHMAPVERRWADGDDIPLRVGRSHAIQTPRDPAFLRKAFRIRWDTSGGTSRVVIENVAGHRVPGLIGRELLFKAVLLDEAGAVVEQARLTVDATAYLPVGSSRDLRFLRAGHTVHLTGAHIDPRADEPIDFLDERLSPAER